MNESNRTTPINKEYRAAPRYQVNLRGSILVLAIGDSTKTDKPYLAFQGQLQNVSLSGLAVIVSFDDMLELRQFGDSVILHLLLPLPAQAIELDAKPVRYQQLKPVKQSEVLIGAQITNMNGRDRILFMEFIQGFEKEAV